MGGRLVGGALYAPIFHFFGMYSKKKYFKILRGIKEARAYE